MIMANDNIDSIAGVFDNALTVLIEHSSESLGSITDGTDADTLENTLQQLLDIMHATESLAADNDKSEDGLSEQDITSIGEHALNFISECSEWAALLRLPETKLQFESISYPIALWIARHGGEINDLEAIVNTLAAISNQTFEQQELEVIATHTGMIINSTSPVISQDIDRSNPARPWRILNLNYGITATRSHNPYLMEESFQTLVHNIPDDADAFFTEGMEQIGALDYPGHVRSVIEKYFLEWSNSHTIH